MPVFAAAADAFVAALTPADDQAWTGPAGELEIAELGDPGSVRRIRFGAPYDARSVRLAATAADLAGLAAGTADGALLYLAGRLDLDGDTGLLLELAPHLRIPGTATAFIDAQALAPEAVAAAIKDVPDAHLSTVMAGPFRPLVLGEVFRRLPEFLDVQKAERARVTVAFVVGGRADGGSDRYVVRVDTGTCTVHPDPAGEQSAEATLLLEGPQFLRLVLGQVNPVRAVLGGEVRVEGQLIKALGFNSVMRIPGI